MKNTTIKGVTIECVNCGIQSASSIEFEPDYRACFYEGDIPDLLIKAVCCICGEEQMIESSLYHSIQLRKDDSGE